jgi:solute carrier family 30 (zinc transporter), member 1
VGSDLVFFSFQLTIAQWLRAEILGAFFNAVFLIALCVSIILEALTRFIDPPEISNPQLILIVGSLGLASNLVGFLVLGGHGHDHSHGEHSHDHEEGHAHDHSEAHLAEEGRVTENRLTVHDALREDGPIGDVLPEVVVARVTATTTASSPERTRHIQFTRGQSDAGRCPSRASAQSRGRERRRASSLRHSRLASIDDISIHPASFRQEIIAASKPQLEEGTASESESEENTGIEEVVAIDEDTPLLQLGNGAQSGHPPIKHRRRDSSLHVNHNHNKPRKAGKKSSHGHSHGDMGMNAMVLHVLGDALGNVGVIVTALIIWLTDWPGKYYADPAVSLFITLIILKSALPLTFATSKILLQATPDHIDINDIREDIQTLPGVVSCHHVHIWQLSDTRIVGSMHIEVSFPISAEGGEKYMELAKNARKCLHAYGIHSVTIQPEFCPDKPALLLPLDSGLHLDGTTSKDCSSRGDICLLECVDDCEGQGCCSTTGSAKGSFSRPGTGTSHSDHGSHNGHHHH